MRRPNSPFVQRVWIALEVKNLQYQYIEVDPYKKPDSLLEVNPRGLVPALRHGDWGCYESTVLLEYVRPILRSNPSPYASRFSDDEADKETNIARGSEYRESIAPRRESAGPSSQPTLGRSRE